MPALPGLDTSLAALVSKHTRVGPATWGMTIYEGTAASPSATAGLGRSACSNACKAPAPCVATSNHVAAPRMNAAEVFLPGLDQGPCVQGPQGVEQAAGAPPLLLACAAAGWCSSGRSTPPAAWQSLSVLSMISISWRGTGNVQILPLLLCYWHITCLGSSQSPDKERRGTAFAQQ